MLVACPGEREIFTPELCESKKGPSAEKEGNGDKHQRKKYINHNITRRREKSLNARCLGPFGDAKVDIKKGAREIQTPLSNGTQ